MSRKSWLALGILLGLAIGGYVGKAISDAFRPLPAVTPDTVYYPVIPHDLREELAKLRSEQRSLNERIKGLQVMPAGSGEGPVRVYEQPIPTDTAVSHARISSSKLDTWLQVPDTAGKSKLVQLPTKDVSGCRVLDIAGNGLVRCQKPVLGVLDVFGSAALGVSEDFRFDDRVGVEWKRTRDSRESINVYVRPFSEEAHAVYFGITVRRNIFGN